jgi:hypothetical protein
VDHGKVLAEGSLEFQIPFREALVGRAAELWCVDLVALRPGW